VVAEPAAVPRVADRYLLVPAVALVAKVVMVEVVVAFALVVDLLAPDFRAA
jgi:hypothetical protein